MKVLFLPDVRLYFRELESILFQQEYFSYEETAIRYVRELITDIQNSLPDRQRRPAPAYFDRFGKNMFYAVFRKSKQTQWYAFFTMYENNGEIIYLVRYISNNHVIAQLL